MYLALVWVLSMYSLINISKQVVYLESDHWKCWLNIGKVKRRIILFNTFLLWKLKLWDT